MTDIEKKYSKWENELKCKYAKIFEDAAYTIFDGVVAPSIYSEQRCKIMVINREPYDDEGNSYSLNEILKQQIEGNIRIFSSQPNFRRHLSQELAVLSLLAEEEFYKKTYEDVTKIVEQLDDDDFSKQIYKVAYTNIKKSDGVNGSSLADLRKYAKHGWDIITEQIRFYNPSVIIGGNIVDGLLGSLPGEMICWGENLFAQGTGVNIYQIEVAGQYFPFFDLYHPSASSFKDKKSGNTISMDDYYLRIFDAMKAVLKEHPDYWQKRLNRVCFV